MNIGQAVKLCRQAVELTQRQAARSLGISEFHLSAIEWGRRSPSTPLMERMRLLFGADPVIVAWLQSPPNPIDHTPATELFRRAYFRRHGIVPGLTQTAVDRL